MFDYLLPATGTGLGVLLADAQTITAIFAPLVGILLAFAGGRKIWSMVKGASRL